MKKIFLPLAIILCLILTFSVLTVNTESSPVTITILHTNDMHGRIEPGDYDGMGLPKLTTLVRELKAENPHLLLLDAGDTIHGRTFTNLVKGESMIKLMNVIGYDAMVPGNHDFNYGYTRLVELAEQTANFPILCANVKKNGKFLFQPYFIKEVNGKKIAIFGLTTPETLYKSHPNNTKGLDFIHPSKAAAEMVTELKKQADFIIALVHLGLDAGSEYTSEQLAKEVGGINLIVDGHSHTRLPTGKMVGPTLIVQAGEYNKNLGRVEVSFTTTNIEMRASLIAKEETANTSEDPEILRLIADENKSQENILRTVIGETTVELIGERQLVRTGETNLGNLLTDAMRILSGADLALTNGGGIRASIARGEITLEEVLEVLPFGNTVVVKEIKGADIISCLEHGTAKYPEANGSFPHVSGLSYIIDLAKPAGQRITDVKVNGRPIILTQTYTVATNDFMASGGDGYTWFAPAKNAGELGGLDEILAEYIRSKGAITPKIEGRIQAIDSSKIVVYIVKKGDVLWKIARKHGTNIYEIIKLNPEELKNPDLIFPGQKLMIQE
ncbi:MAG TPA: multifunctional 2',3'-cyclic-nucleotide 2'-phosphodiesterase/5'-nucleotidase/3'-nucleotidase [Firmicutes bacterium]|jgi:5'-nucleotidase|nr:multifunctional 2',3'-cyclic-nucleotide 2'-phosphodiesterase/5'-nucleotidase/3'-nucleotidase [Bacillota bacterium]